MSSLKKTGSTRRWRNIRLAVLGRDGYACQIRTAGKCTEYATHVDHMHGKTQCIGCKHDLLDHLQAACKACNLSKGKPTMSPISAPLKNFS